MGYLSVSCRAESAVSTFNSLTPSPSFSSSSTTTTSKKQNNKEKEKYIKIQHFHYSDLEAATKNFSERKLLDKRSHGYVYKAVVRGRPMAVKRRVPNWERRVRLALQTAKAIDTLHSSTPLVIHRDIKSASALIDRNFNASLGDFGLALMCHVDDYRLRSTPPAGTMGYLDPCYLLVEKKLLDITIACFVLNLHMILISEHISSKSIMPKNPTPNKCP